MKKLWVMLILVLAILPGCTANNAVPTDPPAFEATPSEQIVPPPTADTTQGEVIVDIPAPTADTGVITGVILLSGNPPKPAIAIIGLGDVLLSTTGDRTLARYDPITDPRMLLDPNGRFFFADVPPGEYVLIYDRITDSLLLNDPLNGGDLIITVVAGQTTDLGELIFFDLPGAE
jgi:hypothetical protein